MIHFSVYEQGLFALLVIGSLYLFWNRFGKVWRTVNASKSDADFTIQPVFRRVRDFVWEVLLQGKVIRERPLPGIAHAFVFWGFCAFALITLNHLAVGFGFHLLSRDSGFGLAYSWFVAIFAVAVAISITGLAVRRFIARPRWLGDVS